MDDVMSSGQTIVQRIDEIMKTARIEVAAVVVIANKMISDGASEKIGSAVIEEKYDTRVYSIITDEDVKKYISCV